MLFSNTLVSFIAAITLAGSVTAAATPRTNPPSGQSCSTGSLTCCTSTTSFLSLPTLVQSGLLGVLDPNVLAEIPIGLNCLAPGLLGCSNTAFCCDGTQNQGGLINIGLNCVNL